MAAKREKKMSEYTEEEREWKRARSSFSTKDDEIAGFDEMSIDEQLEYIKPLLTDRERLEKAMLRGDFSGSLKAALLERLFIKSDCSRAELGLNIHDGPVQSAEECVALLNYDVNCIGRGHKHYDKCFDVIDIIKKAGWNPALLSKMEDIVCEMGTLIVESDKSCYRRYNLKKLDEEGSRALIIYRGIFLGFVREELRTRDLCLFAVKRNFRALGIVPREFLDNEFYREARSSLWTEIYRSLAQRQARYNWHCARINFNEKDDGYVHSRKLSPAQWKNTFGYRPKPGNSDEGGESDKLKEESYGPKWFRCTYDTTIPYVEIMYPDDAEDRYFRLLPEELQREWFEESLPFLDRKYARQLKEKLFSETGAKGATDESPASEENGEIATLRRMLDEGVSELPVNLCSNENCLALVRERPHALERIPREALDRQICEEAVKADPNAIKHVPLALLDGDMLGMLAELDPMSMRHVPDVLISENVCDAAKKKNRNSANFLPQEESGHLKASRGIISDRRAARRERQRLEQEAEMEHEIESNAEKLERLLETGGMLPLELCGEDACWNLISSHPGAIRQIPAQALNRWLCELAVKRDPKAIRLIPAELLDREICKLAVETDPNVMEHVPAEFLDRGIWESALHTDPEMLEQVPAEFLDDGMREYAENRKKEIADDQARKNAWELVRMMDDKQYDKFPAEACDPDTCRALVTMRPGAIAFIPPECLTRELCELAITENPRAIRVIPKKFGDEEMVNLAKRRMREIKMDEARGLR